MLEWIKCKNIINKAGPFNFVYAESTGKWQAR
jgi:hypothetical protein